MSIKLEKLDVNGPEWNDMMLAIEANTSVGAGNTPPTPVATTTTTEATTSAEWRTVSHKKARKPRSYKNAVKREPEDEAKPYLKAVKKNPPTSRADDDHTKPTSTEVENTPLVPVQQPVALATTTSTAVGAGQSVSTPVEITTTAVDAGQSVSTVTESITVVDAGQSVTTTVPTFKVSDQQISYFFSVIVSEYGFVQTHMNEMLELSEIYEDPAKLDTDKFANHLRTIYYSAYCLKKLADFYNKKNQKYSNAFYRLASIAVHVISAFDSEWITALCDGDRTKIETLGFDAVQIGVYTKFNGNAVFRNPSSLMTKLKLDKRFLIVYSDATRDRMIELLNFDL